MATKISGMRELRKKIQALPTEIMGELRGEMEKSANELVAMMKSLAPIGYSGELHDSIGWTWGDPPEGSLVFSQAAGPNDLRLTIYAGNKIAYYVRWVEFGTVLMQAHPFFYPSWRALRKKFKGRNSKAVKNAIEKVANNGN